MTSSDRLPAAYVVCLSEGARHKRSGGRGGGSIR